MTFFGNENRMFSLEKGCFFAREEKLSNGLLFCISVIE